MIRDSNPDFHIESDPSIRSLPKVVDLVGISYFAEFSKKLTNLPNALLLNAEVSEKAIQNPLIDWLLYADTQKQTKPTT